MGIKAELMRKLIYVPVLHTLPELGSLAQVLKDTAIEYLGQAQWDAKIQSMQELWFVLRQEILSWELPYQKLRLYQDGLPICGHERNIVEDLARAGSLNHQLLLELVERGASLMGTESPELLLEEYRLSRELAELGEPTQVTLLVQKQRKIRNKLLYERDRYIGNLISSTLNGGETGILFMGIMHSPQRFIPDDIEIEYPFFSPILEQYQQ
jgi:hypothetical protein